jgi:hypothetical protein
LRDSGQRRESAGDPVMLMPLLNWSA